MHIRLQIFGKLTPRSAIAKKTAAFRLISDRAFADVKSTAVRARYAKEYKWHSYGRNMQVNENRTDCLDELPVVALDTFCTPAAGQLRECRGVRRVTADERTNHFYFDGACVPAGEWTDITHQIVHLGDVRQPDGLSAIGWFSLPPDLKAALDSVMERHAGSKPRVVRHSLRNSDLLNTTKTYLLERFKGAGQISDFEGPSHNSPGLYTVTINRRTGQLQGLHLDSWFGNTFKDKLYPRCRVVLNLGPVSRWFLYVPLQLRTVWNTMPVVYPDQAWDDLTPFGDVDRAILHLHAKVRALRLDPGQGYVAATEAVIHDATTYWVDRTSYNYQLMGDFDWLQSSGIYVGS